MSSFNVILWLVSQVTKTVSCIIFRFFPSNNNNKNTFDFLVVAKAKAHELPVANKD